MSPPNSATVVIDDANPRDLLKRPSSIKWAMVKALMRQTSNNTVLIAAQSDSRASTGIIGLEPRQGGVTITLWLKAAMVSCAHVAAELHDLFVFCSDRIAPTRRIVTTSKHIASREFARCPRPFDRATRAMPRTRREKGVTASCNFQRCAWPLFSRCPPEV